MADSIKERASSFVKMFGSELALEFYHDDIASVVEELFHHHTAESLTQLIKESKILDIPDSLLRRASGYGGLIGEYDTEKLSRMIFGLLCEVRPDLAKTMDIIGEEAAIWFCRCTEAVRDRIANPERYEEEIDKAQTVLVTCDSCHKSWRVFREDANEMKACPFCGASGEEPAPTEEPAPEEEEEE